VTSASSQKRVREAANSLVRRATVSADAGPPLARRRVHRANLSDVTEGNGRAEDWGERFRRRRALYERLTEEIGALLERILDANDIDRVQIERRTKTVDSFVEKIRRKEAKYVDPLTDVTDLCGLRIIAYYLEDLEAIDAALRTEFEVMKRTSGTRRSP
jgi:putative GTP pyrophosphokinase